MYEYNCDQCGNSVRVYVEVSRTITGKPEVWCYRSISHRRRTARRMIEASSYVEAQGMERRVSA
jgi:predicted nucleic acid-binding Zn ribbon protein